MGGLASAALLTVVSAHSATIGTFNNTTVKIGGYVKLDVLYSRYSDGPYSGIGRDFYVPSQTPVTSGGSRSQSYFDMHARQTRVHLATDSKVGGKNLKSYIEIDFMVTADDNADERISNSYNPRMRHAYIEYDKWLFGQTWSTFQNVASLPESVDFIGNTDAGIFVRQPQIRYTYESWQFSIENPETTVGGFGTTDDNTLPDFVGRYNLQHNDLSLALAVLLRQLTIDQAGIDDTETGIGLSVTGKYMIGKDDIRFGINTGSGMGRYIGLNVAPGAVINGSNLESVDSTGLFASFRHYWNQKWRSSFIVSTISIDNNTSVTGTGVTESTTSFRANAIYNVVKNFDLGGEIAFADRELESGTDGDLTRLQFMAMYKF
ncbi:MAG: porin [Gammaproteobacteria bacterium]|nr:porin [Gammaproteobacteria bacterium]